MAARIGFNPFSKHITCKNKNRSQVACINKLCEKYAFICDVKSCTCQKDHVGCMAALTDRIKDSISIKNISVQSIQKMLQKDISKIIQHLIQFKEQTVEKLSKEFQNYGLTHDQKNLIQLLQKGTAGSITGQKLWSIAFCTQNKLNYQKQIEKATKQINSQLSRLDTQIKKRFTTIEKQLITLKDYQKINQRKVDQDLLQQKKSKTKFFQSSTIGLLRDAQNRVVSYFPLNKIYTVKLLYRASQHNFSAEKFRQLCGNNRNTIVICQTQYGKVIGGYTPLNWDFTKDKFANDVLNRSFIFSLTNDQKFSLNPNEPIRQIYCSSKQGPRFGRRDFHILDKANLKQSSYALVGYSYVHSSYQKQSKSANERLIGNAQSCFFRVKQWEVWQLTFEI